MSNRAVRPAGITVAAIIGALLMAAPSSAASAAPLANHPYPGVIDLHVDMTDLAHRVFQVREQVPVKPGATVTLLFPKWSAGDHAPNGPIDRLAGLRVFAGGRRLSWTRDPFDAYAFHIQAPAGVNALDVTYQYLGSPSGDDQDVALITSKVADLQWPTVLLYPAGYAGRDITYRASLRLPPQWSYASSLEGGRRDGDEVRFPPMALSTLADSPVMAGLHLVSVPITSGAEPLRLQLAGADPDDLQVPQGLVDGYRRAEAEALRLFGSRPYRHYDFLVELSAGFGPVYYEHLQSGEQSLPANAMKRWSTSPGLRSALLHGYVHAWNAMRRRPVGMATDTLNQPQDVRLLWMFEGLTDYWQRVLAARAGLIDHDEALAGWASLAAQVSTQSGVAWRPLSDVNTDAIVAGRKDEPWDDWRRDMFDAYGQGELIWLDADTLIRNRTGGRRSLDDFARAFYGGADGDGTERRYTLEDVAAALNAVTPYDWAGFFRTRLQAYDTATALNGVTQGGYRLVYTGEPNATQAAGEQRSGAPNLRYSLGLTLDKTGKVTEVVWGSPAWGAGLANGGTVTTVNGAPYTSEAVKTAVKQSETRGEVTLGVKTDDDAKDYHIGWRGPLRYPQVARASSGPDVLQSILTPRSPASAAAK